MTYANTPDSAGSERGDDFVEEIGNDADVRDAVVEESDGVISDEGEI